MQYGKNVRPQNKQKLNRNSGGSVMASNFDFLEKTFPVLANFGGLAEKYLYSDSNSCLMKLGMIAETIVNLCFRSVYKELHADRETDC